MKNVIEAREVKAAALREIRRLIEVIQGDEVSPADDLLTWDDVSMVAQHAQDLEAACVAWQRADEAYDALIENPGRIVDLGGGMFMKVRG